MHSEADVNDMMDEADDNNHQYDMLFDQITRKS